MLFLQPIKFRIYNSMTQRSRFVWLLLGSAVIFQSGCSCSRIPESPPGPGVLGEVKHFNSGAVVPTAPAPGAPVTNPGSPPPPNTYVNPTPPANYNRPGYPAQPVQVQPQPGVTATQNSGVADAPPDGPTLKPSFPSGSKKK